MRIIPILALFLLSHTTRANSLDSLPAPTAKAPTAKAPTVDVQKMTITDLQKLIATSDHPLIINFWATFCAPCNKEIPYFQSTVAQHRTDRLELILVSLDLPDYFPRKIDSFVRQQGYTARIVWLNETDADYFCPRVDPSWTGGIPSSLFINNKTHYRRFFDRQLTEPQVEFEIKKMLAPAAN